MGEQGASTDDRLRAFVSYSRSDLGEARKLRDALIAEGIDAYLDVEDIVKGEPWRERLGRLIASADALIFLLSPDSVASDVCGWEVNEAERLGKRVLPVVTRHTPQDAVPGRLSRLNYTFLDTPEKRDAEFPKLLSALREDADWVREHTRLGEIAERWRAAGAPSRLLLRGEDIDAAERWRDGRPAGAPEPTADHRRFIDASRRAATRRQRWWIGGASLVAAGATALAAVAVVQSVEADRQRDAALLTQSRFLSDLARQSCDAGDAGACAALALEAAPKPELGDPRPYAPEAEAALLRSLAELRERKILFAVEAPIRALSVDPGGAWIAALARTDHQTGRPAVAADGETPGRIEIRRLSDGALIRSLTDPDAADPDALALDADPTGGAVAAADRDGRVRVFDPETGALIRLLDAFDRPALALRYAPDGGALAVAAGARARIFETDGWTEIARVDQQVATITSLAFSRDGAEFAVTTSDGAATLWRLDPAAAGADPAAPEGSAAAAFEGVGARFVNRVKGEQGWAQDATFGDGRRHGLLFANADGAITATRPALRLDAHRAGITALALDPTGDRLASAAEDGALRLWRLDWLDFDTDQARALAASSSLRLAGHTGPATALDWTSDGALISGGADGVARLWSVEPFLSPTPFGGRDLFCVALGGFALEGRAVATGCGDGALRLWDPETGREVWASDPLPGVQPRISLSTDGRRAAALSSGGEAAQVFDLADRRAAARLAAAPDDDFLAAALDPTGARLATASASGVVALWDAETGAPLGRFETAHEKIVALAFSPDGALVASSGLEGSAQVWDAADAALRATLKSGDTVVWKTFFLRDGAQALTISGDGSVRLWSTGDGREIRSFEGHRRAVKHAAVGPDERRLVTLGLDGVRIWSLETGALLRRFDDLRADSAAFRPDGARLALGLGARRALILSTENWATVGVLPHSAAVSEVAFAPSGGALASAAPTAALWRIPETTEALVAEALRAAPRCLTPEARAAAFLAPEIPDWCRRAGLWPHRPANAEPDAAGPAAGGAEGD